MTHAAARSGSSSGSRWSKTPQKRLGRKEAAAFNKIKGSVKAYKIFRGDKNRGETRFNDRLMDYLRQTGSPVENTQITPARFVGETFRPEFLLRGKGKYPLCAVECKKLTDRFAKSRWKEGLSQSLMYMHYYKRVLYVLYDYTTDATYANAFGQGNRAESRFARLIREALGVHVIALRPA